MHRAYPPLPGVFLNLLYFLRVIMLGYLAVPLSILTTALSWGVYGVVLKWGSEEMAGSRLRSFICVGLAYFLIAVLVPAVILRMQGEKGSWTTGGFLWSFIAGVLGALGALGILLALTFKGSPIYVMPLVFGGAPVINTFTSMFFARNFKVNPFFLAGMILVIAGAALVLIFQPKITGAVKGPLLLEMWDWIKIIASIALTIVCWGAYGPTLHKGQMAMQGSRLRPLICVGLAYFLVAVVIPFMLIPLVDSTPAVAGGWTFGGFLWSFGAGAAGAIGALGIILAFNYGGKPNYVMPLVFGGAPIVNTFFSLATSSGTLEAVNPIFYSGLMMAIIGAVCVLVFAPKGGGPQGTPHTPSPGLASSSAPSPAANQPAASGVAATANPASTLE